MASLVALTGDNTLVAFKSGQPNDTHTVSVTGLDGTLLGIDTRPANGMLYGITDNDTLYTINLETGEATFASSLSLPFNATSVSGFDFNPVADRLRLVGDNDQDFRINVDTGEVTVDGDLAFASDDANAGDDPSVTAAAYTNSFDGTTSTMLYDIDEAQDILVLQDPPNDGVLQTVGSLGIDFDRTGGFEIASMPSGTNEAFAVTDSTLYSIDLGSGAATSLGAIGSNNIHYRGLTVRPDVDINPIAQDAQFLALTDDDRLVSFDPNQLGMTRTIDISGIDAPLLGIDTRPSNGLIYGITTNNTVYTINPNTGVATFVSTLDTPFESMSVSGFDFNPVADRLRLVGENDQDFRINVETGEVTIDGDLAYAQGDVNEGANPRVTAAAYANSIANPSTTALYDIDTDLDILALQNPPNDGILSTRGPLGFDIDHIAGFDIVSSGEEDVGARIMAGQELQQNAAFAVADGALYDISILTGAATRLGDIGDGSGSFKGLATIDRSAIVNPIAQNTQFLALTDDDQLVSFDPNSANVTATIEISGLDAPLLGIDTRPSNGLIYGITTNNTVYTINPNTGVATFVSTLDTPFESMSVSGFDFNPVADRLRLVGENDQDFRINVETGEVTIDGDLAYAQGDVNEGANPRVTAAAYANSIANPSTTALYDIDTDLDILALQNPPNDGILSTRGPLGFDIDHIAGFDIISSGEEDVGARIMAGQNLQQNAAFAVADGALYGVDILTGQATLLSEIGDGSQDFKGLATVDRSAIVDPIARESTFLALTDDGQIASFNPSDPSAAETIDITGLGDGEVLLGFDTRPANGLIYGITDADNIYTIDPTSGSATFVSTLDMPFNAEQISGFDFNPVADRLRLVGDNDQDFRINVDTGEVTVDGDLAFAAGDVNEGADPQVTAAAYTNAIANPTTTQLYDIDTALDTLVLQNPPNDGTLMTIGELGVDFGELGGFNIVSRAEGSNAAFAVSNGTLYGINLMTGAASDLGAIGDGMDNFVGFTTIASGGNGNGGLAPILVQADSNGITNGVVYDVTGASGAIASLGIDPGLASSAGFDNFVGLYEVTSAAGGVDVDGDGIADFNPGDDGYAAAAIGQRAGNIDILTGGSTSNDTTQASFGNVSLRGGTFYAPFLIANLGNATPEDFLTNNPDNEAATFFGDTVAYFSFIEANPDGVGHLMSLGSSLFGFEDLPDNLGVSDNDFNDAVFQIDITLA